MSITAWRIVKKKHQATGFSGEGARRYGGRWNSPGVAVIYASASIALAALEMLVHLQSQEILRAYAVASLAFSETMVEDVAKIPRNWRRDPAPVSSQMIGDLWIAQATSAVLRVPSVLVASEWNYLVNPAHPNFECCVLGEFQPFKFDARLAK